MQMTTTTAPARRPPQCEAMKPLSFFKKAFSDPNIMNTCKKVFGNVWNAFLHYCTAIQNG